MYLSKLNKQFIVLGFALFCSVVGLFCFWVVFFYFLFFFFFFFWGGGGVVCVCCWEEGLLVDLGHRSCFCLIGVTVMFLITFRIFKGVFLLGFLFVCWVLDLVGGGCCCFSFFSGFLGASGRMS